MISTSFDLAIIGAGISGLTLGRLASQAGMRVLVLERAGTPGGALRSERTLDGYWFELGAHTLYDSYGALIGHLESVELRDKIQKRAKVPFKLLVEGSLRSIPSQINKGELFASAWRAFTARKQGKSVREYYGGLVGEKNWKKVFSALLAAVPSQCADDFPADMLFKKRPRRKDLPRTFTIEGGLSSLVEALANLPGVSLRTETPIQAIQRQGAGFALHTEAGEIIPARQVALAVPPQAAANLVAEVLPAAAAPLAGIRMAAIDSLGVVLSRDDLALPPVAGIVPLDEDFFSIVTRDVVPHPGYRAATFHFRAGLTREERLARVAQVLRTSPDRFRHVAENHVQLPSPGRDHRERVAALEASLPDTGLYVTGNYFGGLAIEDCALRSQQEFRRLINEHK